MDFDLYTAMESHNEIINNYTISFAKSWQIILESIENIHSQPNLNNPHIETYVPDFLNQHRNSLPRFIEKSKKIVITLKILKDSIFDQIHDRWSGTYFPNSYDDIMASIVFFFEFRKHYFDDFYDYIKWLFEWASNSPSLLYAKHTSWADTDRRLRLDSLEYRRNIKNLSRKEGLKQIIMAFTGIYEWEGSTLTWAAMYNGVMNNLESSEENPDEGSIKNRELLKYLKSTKESEIQSNFIVLFLTYNKILNTFRSTLQNLRDAITRIVGTAETILKQYRYIQDNEFLKWMIFHVIETEANETNYFDFKFNIPWWDNRLEVSKVESKTTKFIQQITSFANSNGGMIVIGIDDDFNVTGLDYEKRDLENKINSLKLKIEGKTNAVFASEISSWIKVIELLELGKKLVVLLIPQTDYYTDVNDEYFIRGSSGKTKEEFLNLKPNRNRIYKGTNFEWLETFYKQYLTEGEN